MAMRERRLTVICGRKGTGKTALVRQMVRRYPGRVRGLAPAPAPDWKWAEWPGSSPEALREWVRGVLGCDEEMRRIGKGHTGLLVLDDASTYLGAMSHPRDGFRELWNMNRHFGLDVVIVGHRPQTLPKDVFGNADEIWLFAQREARALEYLESIGGLEDLSGHDLPSGPGEALRFRAETGEVSRVRIFK